MKLTHEQLKENLTKLGLIVNGKPVTKKLFTEYADFNQYGRGKPSLYVIYIGVPKENLFGFYPHRRTTKVEALSEAYDMYKNIVLHNDYYYKIDYIQWGNCGYPLSYGNLRTI